MTDTAGTPNDAPCGDCLATLLKHLRAEAERLLAASDTARRRGDHRNAAWSYRAAFGVARAIGVLKRAA